MILTLLSVLNAPVTVSTPRTCRIEDVRGVITEDGPHQPPASQESFQILVQGCQRNYGQAACPHRIEFNAKTNHTKVFCGNEVNTASEK